MRIATAMSAFDGSTGTNAYHANATCVWVLESDAGCVSLDATFVAAQAPFDVLEAFGANGVLLGRWTGRSGAAHPLLKACADPDATDADDEQQNLKETLESLTARERYICYCWLNGWTLKQIGKKLGISPQRVNVLRRRALARVAL